MALVSVTIGTLKQLSSCPPTLPDDHLRLDVATQMFTNPEATSRATTASDFGRLTHAAPAAVLRPTSELDIAVLVRSSYTSASRSFTVAARGHGHLTRGQATAADGVVVEMRAMAGAEGKIKVVTGGPVPFVDAFLPRRLLGWRQWLQQTHNMQRGLGFAFGIVEERARHHHVDAEVLEGALLLIVLTEAAYVGERG